MYIVYRNHSMLKYGDEREFRDLPRPSAMDEWYIGIDGSSTSYGFALYTYDYSKVHLFMFCRAPMEDAEKFRGQVYEFLQHYLQNLQVLVATYERTPEGYKPPETHAEKVMRDTERSVKNFLSLKNYVYIENKEHVFDIFPNTWKAFSIPKADTNLGKIDKRQNAEAVLDSCGLSPAKWLDGFDKLPYPHSYDSFEALGVGRYGSHYLVNPESGYVKVYKNFSRVGDYLVAAKRLDLSQGLSNELPFVGGFGAGKHPRICELNETKSLAENLFGLVDKEYNNILLVERDHPYSIYIDNAFGFPRQESDYLILATKATRAEVSTQLCVENGFRPIYL